jgi:hypothetical protein
MTRYEVLARAVAMEWAVVDVARCADLLAFIDEKLAELPRERDADIIDLTSSFYAYGLANEVSSRGLTQAKVIAMHDSGRYEVTIRRVGDYQPGDLPGLDNERESS